MNSCPWLVELADPAVASTQALYVIPAAGGGVAAARPLCRALGDHVTTVAVRLPGRESLLDEPPVTDMAVLADELARQIRAHSADREAVLLGHCSGALIAYEVTRRLSSGKVGHLVVSAQQAPDRVAVTAASQLSDDDFLAAVRPDAYLPAEALADPIMRQLLLTTLRGDYRLMESYHSSVGTVDAPILALLGLDDESLAVDDVRCWRRFTAKGFRLQQVPGSHHLLHGGSADVVAALKAIIG